MASFGVNTGGQDHLSSSFTTSQRAPLLDQLASIVGPNYGGIPVAGEGRAFEQPSPNVGHGSDPSKGISGNATQVGDSPRFVDFGTAAQLLTAAFGRPPTAFEIIDYFGRAGVKVVDARDNTHLTSTSQISQQWNLSTGTFNVGTQALGRINVPVGPNPDPSSPDTGDDGLPDVDVETPPPPDDEDGGPGPTPFDQDAFLTIERILTDWGLSSLIPWAKDLIQNQATSDQVKLLIYDQPAFQERFKVIFDIQDWNTSHGLDQQRVNFTPEEVLQFETEYGFILARGGLDYFATQDYIHGWLFNQVSPAEVSRRITEGFNAVRYATPETRAFFADAFGPDGDTALAAYYLDSANLEEELVRQAQIAQIGGAARLTDIGIGVNRATQLNQLGINPRQAHAGFASINARRGLFRETVSETQNLSRSQEGVTSEFGLDSGRAAELLEQRLRTRLSAFRGGGGALVSAQGTGLGSA